MSILLTTDFSIGLYQITQSTDLQSSEELQESIDRIEEEKLIQLLGNTLYATFIAALAGTPAQKWIDLRDGKVYTNTEWNQDIKFKGVKEMLKPFVYSDFILKSESVNTPIGNTKLHSRTSEKVNRLELKNQSCRAYNKGIDLYVMSRDFLRENRLDYPFWEYKNLTHKIC